mgnify:CR=1 FL=1
MIDWQLCLNLLRKYCKTLSKVARYTGCDERHLQRIARGEVDEPRFNSGVKLLDLAYDVLPETEFRRLRREA